ncbi:MAG: hypothetical protein N2050_03040 [Flavobacteriales bacterium]|nr:hypothetical protein [Flavobacteriales bacterium]MCX7649516.1 hypothetical protein [Flavobacteriales bacterium]MDW8431778.1 hypothetical protein [Flavobacteriales bacterium]
MDFKIEFTYIIAARLYAPIQQMLAAHKTWMVVGNGIEIAERMY